MSDYLADVRKYSAKARPSDVEAIVKSCGRALKSRDTALVAVTDASELKRIKAGFAKKKLGLDAEAAEAGIKAATAAMKGVRAKSRVTFYYLLAEATRTLSKLR